MSDWTDEPTAGAWCGEDADAWKGDGSGEADDGTDTPEGTTPLWWMALLATFHGDADPFRLKKDEDRARARDACRDLTREADRGGLSPSPARLPGDASGR